ncbi:hypothetical protein QYM36_002600 [Artemia franciscana]|uniref:Uncharacterized protein n=1 Tax=Artemia franciscana TaxID=6661 RepID=A0AA88IDA3_ARTSF|nr:hypothetical protein QYM36_002600 [Artemia franciscana]
MTGLLDAFFFKAFDSRQFQLECLLEEDKDKLLESESLEMENNGTLSLKQLLETANIEKKESEGSMEQHILKSTQLQQDIDSLLCEKSNFEAKLKLLETEEIEKQKKIEALLKELEVERDHVSKPQFEKNDTLGIKKSLETMSIEKQTLEKLIEDQDLVVSSLKKDIDLLQCQKEQLEKEKGALQCDQKETQERVDLLQCQKEQLEKEKGVLQCEQKATQKRVDLLQCQKEQLEKEKGALQCDQKETQKRVDLLQCQKEQLEKEKGVLQCEQKETQKRVDLLQCQKEQLEKEKGALQCEQQETQQIVDLLQCQKEQLEKEKGALQCEHQETQKRVELLLDLEIERTDSGVNRQKLEELRLEMDEMKDDLADKGMPANGESHRGTDGEDKLEAVTAERDSLFTQLSEMMHKLQVPSPQLAQFVTPNGVQTFQIATVASIPAPATNPSQQTEIAHQPPSPSESSQARLFKTLRLTLIDCVQSMTKKEKPRKIESLEKFRTGDHAAQKMLDRQLHWRRRSSSENSNPGRSDSECSDSSSSFSSENYVPIGYGS